MPKQNRYDSLIVEIFKRHYRPGSNKFSFERSEIEEIAKKHEIKLPKNLGDLIYSYRYRKPLPDEITRTSKKGLEWIIEPAGRSQYEFRLARINRIIPRDDLLLAKIPDATPKIISANAMNDEQALLAKVRYNRLVDIFLGITAYSLQNHLRTTVREMGQIEIDEVYVGVNKHGAQFVIPVQAKGGKDRLAIVQTKQDIACCKEKFPLLICRAISAQFMPDGKIAMFELCLDGNEVKVKEEKHYKLVSAAEITPDDLRGFSLG
ncbi:MAG: endonuclease [Nitrospinae bacterium]|nr:endonuclease [Nitrospinota bacterium]